MHMMVNMVVMYDRYGLLVYNGSVHYWRISRILQRDGLRAHLLPSEQTVVDAVRKLPDKQEWLSSLLLQLSLGQLEVILDRAAFAQSAITTIFFGIMTCLFCYH